MSKQSEQPPQQWKEEEWNKERVTVLNCNDLCMDKYQKDLMSMNVSQSAAWLTVYDWCKQNGMGSSANTGIEQVIGFISPLQSKIEELKGELADYEKLVGTQQEEIEMLKHENEVLNKEKDTYTYEWFELKSKISSLEQENVKYKKDLADAAGELMVPIPEPGTMEAKMLSANTLLRWENEKLREELNELKGTG